MISRRIDTKAMIDRRPFGSYQVWVFIMCFLAATVDGYDAIVIGAAIPGIRETLHLQPATLGIILTAGQIGVMAGAFFLGPVSDRIGRKGMVIISACIFGLFSFLTAFATSVTAFIVLRVLAGIGMGGIVPAVLACATEYAPQRLKATIVALVWMALPVGGMIAGFSAVWLLPRFGWTALFILGGLLPLVLVPFLAAILPESLAYLGARGGDQPRMRRIALRIDPSLPADAELYIAEEKLPGVPLKHLFTEGRAVGTILLWIVFFLSFFLMLFFTSWIPTLIRMTTGSVSAIGTSLAMWNIGSLLATAIIGRLIDKFGYYRVLPPAFVLIALAAWTVGFFVTAPLTVILGLIAVVGFFTGGTNSGLMALAANSYPVSIRSTGLGACYALGGRTGSMCGPLLGGILLQLNWSPSEICYVIGAPMLLGTIVLLLLRTQAAFRHDPIATERPQPAAAPA
ncbi:MAG TPA: MFS transporter [Stellaceae bacterium]|nr:MFS transporter [Stellaceae bacterium]